MDTAGYGWGGDVGPEKGGGDSLARKLWVMTVATLLFLGWVAAAADGCGGVVVYGSFGFDVDFMIGL